MAELTPAPRVVVIQFPGVNNEHETARALRSVRLRGDVVRWNAPEAAFADAAAYVLPGGFSYEDRVRGGAIAAREPVLERIERAARDGVPVLGICNGAQVLVEAGLVPGNPEGRVELALAPNRMPDRSGYYTRWVELELTSAASPFATGQKPGTRIPMPMAHGEGRFATADEELARAIRGGKNVLFRYAGRGREEPVFPDDPNGSIGHAAGVLNGEGNVLALMPHPERAAWLWQVPPHIRGVWGDRRRALRHDDELPASAMTRRGPGRAIFESLARHLGVS